MRNVKRRQAVEIRVIELADAPISRIDELLLHSWRTQARGSSVLHSGHWPFLSPGARRERPNGPPPSAAGIRGVFRSACRARWSTSDCPPRSKGSGSWRLRLMALAQPYFDSSGRSTAPVMKQSLAAQNSREPDSTVAEQVGWQRACAVPQGVLHGRNERQTTSSCRELYARRHFSLQKLLTLTSVTQFHLEVHPLPFPEHPHPPRA